MSNEMKDLAVREQAEQAELAIVAAAAEERENEVGVPVPC